MTIGQKIKELRKNRGWTQKKLAEKTGMHLNQIKYYEAGDRCPSVDNLKRLCTALKRSLSAFDYCDPYVRRQRKVKKVISLDEFLQRGRVVTNKKRDSGWKQ